MRSTERHSLDPGVRVERRAVIGHERVTLTLPFPPLVGAVDGNGFASRQHETWQEEAALAVKTQSPKRIGGPVEIVVTLANRDRCGTMPNLIKLLTNFLARMNVIDETHSSVVRRLTFLWSEDERDARIEITRSPMARAA